MDKPRNSGAGSRRTRVSQDSEGQHSRLLVAVEAFAVGSIGCGGRGIMTELAQPIDFRRLPSRTNRQHLRFDVGHASQLCERRQAGKSVGGVARFYPEPDSVRSVRNRPFDGIARRRNFIRARTGVARFPNTPAAPTSSSGRLALWYASHGAGATRSG